MLVCEPYMVAHNVLGISGLPVDGFYMVTKYTQRFRNISAGESYTVIRSTYIPGSSLGIFWPSV